MMLVTLPTMQSAQASLGVNASASDIISGEVHSDLDHSPDEDVSNGLRLSIDDNGRVKLQANGTISSHAMRRLLEG